MAKDDKKRKQTNNNKKNDKDIHLNVLGIPQNNVQVKKASHVGSDDYQLYKISIDTKNKDKEKKVLLGNFEPTLKRVKKRKEEEMRDKEISSSDSGSRRVRSPRHKARAGQKRERDPYSKTSKKEPSDSEICFTIPGEKGKAIKIVGSPATDHYEKSPSTESEKPRKGKKGPPPRQVGFAKLDEVYGTSLEETTDESNDSIPYKRTSPQVYKVEHMTPDVWFKDPSKGIETGNRKPEEKPSPTKRTSKERRDSEEQEPHGSGPRIKKGKIDSARPSTRKSGDDIAEYPSSEPLNALPDHSKPRSSKSYSPHEISLKSAPSSASSSIPGTSYERDTNDPEEEMYLGKGKYPYYPYNKAKRSIPQSADAQDPDLSRQNEERSYKQEPYTHKKLPSIPEVRSFTEHHTTASLDSEDEDQPSSSKQPTGRKTTGKEPTSPLHPHLDKPNDAEMQKSETLPKSSQPYRTSESPSPISKSQREPTLTDGEIKIQIDNAQKTNKPFNISTSTSPVQIIGDRIKHSQPNLSKTTREPKLESKLPTNETSKLPQSSQSVEKPKTSTGASPKFSDTQRSTDQTKNSESLTSKTQSESTPLGEDTSQAKSRSLQPPKPSSQNKVSISTSPVPSRERKVDGESKISHLPSFKTQSEQKLAKEHVSRDQLKPIPGKKPAEKHTIGASTSPILNAEPTKGVISFPYKKQKDMNLDEEPIFTKNVVPSGGKYNAQQHRIQKVPQETVITKQPYKPYGPNLEVKPKTVNQQEGTLNKMLPGTPKDSTPTRDGSQNDKSPATQSFQNVKTPFSISQPLGKSANSNIVTTASKRISPIMVDKEISADTISGKEKSSKINPKPFSSRKTSKEEVSKVQSTSHEKEPKSSKSKISAFVSSIPKPFRRSKSPTSLEKQNADKNVGSMTSHHEDGPFKTLHDRQNMQNETRKPVAESIMKQENEPEERAYPVWKMSTERQKSDNQKTAKPKPLSNLSQKGATPARANSDSEQGKIYLPVGILDSPSLEISSRTYGEQPFTDRASRIQEAPFQISYRHASSPPSRTKVSEEVSKSFADHQEDEPPNFHRLKDDSKGAGLGSWEKIGRRDSKEEFERGKKETGRAEKLKTPIKSDEVDGFEILEDEQHKDRFDWDGLGMPDYNYGKGKDGFAAPTVIAYPGQVNEQTPFGYDSMYKGDPHEEDQALISLENAFEARDQLDRSRDIQKSHLSYPNRPDSTKIGKPEDSLLSQEQQNLNVNDGNEGKSSSYKYPSSKGSKAPGPLPVSKEKEKPQKNFSKSTTEKGILKYSSDAVDDKKDKTSKSPDRSVFGREPDEHIVFPAGVPGTNSKVFLASGSPKDEKNKGREDNKRKKPSAEGPKGILIFVNRKNETSNPFEKSGKGRVPHQDSESYTSKTKKTDGRPAKKGKKRKSLTSSDNTSVSTSMGRSVGAGGDKKVKIEKSPSGTRITQRHPCGCIRILSSDPNNQLKKEEIVSAYCKYGSKCEIGNPQLRKGELMIPMDESTTSGGSGGFGGRQGDSVRLLPDIEVFADGVISRKPIKPRSPAPTMKGANFTGTLNIQSNKLNGVYNFYLDSKLKQYLRNNIDKFKVLLEDDARR